MRKICVYGLAGSGKSTVSAMIRQALIERGYHVDILKLAEPMYRLQQIIYRTAGVEVDLWEHDNRLLRLLATELRRINPTCIVDDFLARTGTSTADIVINDDCRDADIDYPAMAGAGFQFVHITCDHEGRTARVAARGDRTVVADSAATWGHDRMTANWTIDNSSEDLGRLRHHVDTLVNAWLRQRIGPSAP